MTTDTWIFWGAAGLGVAACLLVYRVREAVGHAQSVKMETYLRREKEAGSDRGHRSTKHLMLQLGLTKGQVLAASRRSAAIKRLPTTANFPGALFAELPMFEYAPVAPARPKQSES